ncbi:MAG: AMIN domain-containing protein, partial [Candidatus Electrothrix sp. EH2]|nr:AMIN domain-containing protein [Candidatus Electrothrix sp. EH2]
MLKNISAVTVALVFLLFQGWQVAAAQQKMLEDISFESSGNGEERIIFKLNGTYIPKIFTLQGKQPRVVFDFKDTAAAKMINNIINTNGELIKRIRVGIHKGDDPKTRVVLDLRPNKHINIRQDFDKKKKSLVISVHYAGSKQAAEKQKSVEQDKAPKERPARASIQTEKKQDDTAETAKKTEPVSPQKKKP